MSSATPYELSDGQRVKRRFTFSRAVFALMLREMATRYGRSPGGYVWALLEPLGSIIVLAVAFSVLLRSPSLGTSFIVFYATGFLPFNIFLSVSNMMANAITFSKPLLFYPAVTWADAVIARFLLNTLTGILIMIVLMISIIYATGVTLVLDLIPILIGVCLVLLIAAGVGMLNAVLFGLFPVWRQIWGITTRPLMLVSGVIFIYEDLPKAAQDIIWYNPLIHITGLVRTGFYATYSATYVSISYVAICAIVPLFLGTLLMTRFHRDILNS
ncbi:MAG: ABC transporter permease [Yoonia sp.]|uniref:ABC transporter permease n=1 Tax=Yoonia sp. TaxID=2212373 RepID=UPI003EF92F7E